MIKILAQLRTHINQAYLLKIVLIKIFFVIFSFIPTKMFPLKKIKFTVLSGKI